MDTLGNNIQMTITAVDNGWTMGEDLVFGKINADTKLTDLANNISKLKGIPTSRMAFKLPPSRSIPRERWDKPLSHCGIHDKTKVILEPTLTGCWQWHHIDYYWEQTLQKIIATVKNSGDNGMKMDELERLVPFPPPMKRECFVSFVRKYPDVLHVETSIDSGKMHVRLNSEHALPIWL